MERVKLLGSKKEQIYKMLKLAGWYENRKVDISEAENYYEYNNIEMYDSIKAFYQEFYGISEYWYIKVKETDYAPNFEFCLFSKFKQYLGIKDYMFDDAEYEIPSQDYKNVYSCANEEFAMIGSIGYYYPAVVWMGKSGNLYATHEYDNNVHIFSSVFGLIEYELAKVPIESVIMKR